MNLIVDPERRIIPEAVCDSHKSGVEHNVLGRLLILTFIHFCKAFQMTGYLRGEIPWEPIPHYQTKGSNHS